MLYIAIPSHNEVETLGVLLWRLRTVLAEFPRDYEVVVYDDASTDGTPELLEPYRKVLPLTVLGGDQHVGYAHAVDRLVRHVVRQTRHPRRDALLLLQADFTDPPGLIPEFARRFEGGADLVIAERTNLADAPDSLKKLFRFSSWSMRSFVRVDGVRDATSTLRLVRISALRDLLQIRGDAPVCEGDTWTANADLLLNLVPLARRLESVPIEPTYGVRIRATRRVPMRDAIAALKWAWRARRRRVRTAAAETEAAPRRGARDDRPLVLSPPPEDAPVNRRQRPERGDRKPLSERHRSKPADVDVVQIDDASNDERPGRARKRRDKRRRKTRGGALDGNAAEGLAIVRDDATDSLEQAAVDEVTNAEAEGRDDIPGEPGADAAADERRRKRRRRRKRARGAAAAGEGNGESNDLSAESHSDENDNAGGSTGQRSREARRDSHADVDRESPYREEGDASSSADHESFDNAQRDSNLDADHEPNGDAELEGDDDAEAGTPRARSRRGRRGRRGGRRMKRRTNGDVDSSPDADRGESRDAAEPRDDSAGRDEQ